MASTSYFTVKDICRTSRCIVSAVTTKYGGPPVYAKKEYTRFRLSSHIVQTIDGKAEIFTLRMLNHPHIVKILDYRITQTETFIILPLATSDFSKYLNCTPVPPLEHRLRYAHQVISILVYLQHNRITHNDVKLENFLYFEGSDGIGEIKLCDLSFSFHPIENPDITDQTTSPVLNRAPETHRFLHSHQIDLSKVKAIEKSGSIHGWAKYDTQMRLTAEMYSFGKILLNIYTWEEYGDREGFYFIDDIVSEGLMMRRERIHQLVLDKKIDSDAELEHLIARMLEPDPLIRSDAGLLVAKYDKERGLKNQNKELKLSFPSFPLPSQKILERNDQLVLQAFRTLINFRNPRYTIGLIDRVLALISNSIGFYMGSMECNGPDGFDMFVNACVDISIFHLHTENPWELSSRIYTGTLSGNMSSQLRSRFLSIMIDLINHHECSIVHEHFSAFMTHGVNGGLIFKCLKYYYTYSQHGGQSMTDYMKLRSQEPPCSNRCYTPATPLKDIWESDLEEYSQYMI